MIYKIQRFFIRLKYFPRNFMGNIHNLIIWFPIIWKDRQWDYSFLFTIMLKKMELMEDYFNSESPVSADAKIYAKDINTARTALDYIASGQYEEDAYAPWHDVYTKNIELLSVKDIIDSVNKEKSIEERDVFESCNKTEERLYEEYMNIFCNTFKEKVLWWWD